MGKSLALRLGFLDHEILLGSRTAEKAVSVATELSARVSPQLNIQGVANEQAAQAEIVFLTTPWEGVQELVQDLRTALSGKIVVSLVNALTKVGPEMQPLTLPRGSVAQSIQALLPESYVVSGLHHVPAKELGTLEGPVDVDVLVCSDVTFAKEKLTEILSVIPGLRILDAGSLSNSGAIEAMTAILINLNIKYRTRSAIRVTGIKDR